MNVDAASVSALGSVVTRPSLKFPALSKAMAPMLLVTFNMSTPANSETGRHPTSLPGSAVVSWYGTQPPSPPGSTALSQNGTTLSALLGSLDSGLLRPVDSWQSIRRDAGMPHSFIPPLPDNLPRRPGAQPADFPMDVSFQSTPTLIPERAPKRHVPNPTGDQTSPRSHQDLAEELKENHRLVSSHLEVDWRQAHKDLSEEKESHIRTRLLIEEMRQKEATTNQNTELQLSLVQQERTLVQERMGRYHTERCEAQSIILAETVVLQAERHRWTDEANMAQSHLVAQEKDKADMIGKYSEQFRINQDAAEQRISL